MSTRYTIFPCKPVWNCVFNISADTVVKSITVWNGNEKVNSIGRFSTGIANIAFTKVVTVPAGQTVKLPIKINVNNTAGVASELKISLLEVKSDTALAGTFPMVGNAFTIADADLGTLNVEKSGDAPSASVNAGDKNVRLAKFNFEVGSEAQIIKRVVFSQDGTAADTDLANLKLVDEDGTVLALGQLDKGELVFDLNKDCISGTTARLTIRGDVVGGAGRTVQFSVDNVNDVQSVGKIYGTTIVASGTAYGSVIEIDKGAFILTKAASSPASSTVAKTVDDQKFAAISVETVGEPVQLETITVDIQEDGNGDNTAVREVKLVSNGVVVASQEVKKTSDIADGLELPLSEVLTVEPGSPTTIDILLDLRNAETDASYKVGILSIVGTGMVSGKDVEIPAKEEDGNVVVNIEEGTYGNTMTVGDIKITIEPAAEIDGYAFQNQASIELAEFDISHNLGDTVRLTSVTLNIAGKTKDKTGAPVDIKDAEVQKTFKNFRLVSTKGDIVSETIVNPKSTVLKIALKEGLTVDAGKTLKLRLVADIRTQANPGDTFTFTATNAAAVTIATGTKVEIDEAVSASRVITIANGVKNNDVKASQSIENEPKDKNVVAGDSKEVEIARWRLTNESSEAVKVNKVYLTPEYDGQKEDLKYPYVKYVLKSVSGSNSAVQLTDTFTMAEAKEIKILKDSNDNSKLVIDAMKDDEVGEVELVLYAKVVDGAQIGGTVSVALGKATVAKDDDGKPLAYNSKVDFYEITGKESGLTAMNTDNYVAPEDAVYEEGHDGEEEYIVTPAVDKHEPTVLRPGKDDIKVVSTVALSKVDLSAHSSGTTREKVTGDDSTTNATVANFTIKNEGSKTVGIRQVALKVTDRPFAEGASTITKLDIYAGGEKLTLRTPEGISAGEVGKYVDGKIVPVSTTTNGDNITAITKEGWVIFNISGEAIKLKAGETKKFEIKAPEALKAGESISLSLDRDHTFIDKPSFAGYKITLDRNTNDEDTVLVPLGTYTAESK